MKYLGYKNNKHVSKFIRKDLGFRDLNLCYSYLSDVYKFKSRNGHYYTIDYYLDFDTEISDNHLASLRIIKDHTEIVLDVGVAKYNKWVFKEILYSDRTDRNYVEEFSKSSSFFQSLKEGLGEDVYVLEYLTGVSLEHNNIVSFSYEFIRNKVWRLLIQRVYFPDRYGNIFIIIQELGRNPIVKFNKSTQYSFRLEGESDELNKIGMQSAEFIKGALDEMYK